MKTVYRAADGTKFNSEVECCQYETRNLAFHLWDKDGRTHEIEHALVVNIWSENGVGKFRELSANEGNTSDGIEEPGMYIWDYVHFEYLPLEDELQSALQHIFTDL